jgi:Rhomboid family
VSRGFRAPWISLGFVTLAIAVSLDARSRGALIFERASIEAGQWWRLWSAHLVHSWPTLAAVDLGMVLVLGAWVEHRSRRVLACALLASTTAASLALLFWRTDLATYQGSSAFACALLTLAGTRILIEGKAWLERGIAALALVLFAVKTCVELSHAAPFGVVPLPSGVEVVAIAHAAGGVAGFVIGARLRTAPR